MVVPKLLRRLGFFWDIWTFLGNRLHKIRMLFPIWKPQLTSKSVTSITASEDRAHLTWISSCSAQTPLCLEGNLQHIFSAFSERRDISEIQFNVKAAAFMFNRPSFCLVIPCISWKGSLSDPNCSFRDAALHIWPSSPWRTESMESRASWGNRDASVHGWKKSLKPQSLIFLQYSCDTTHLNFLAFIGILDVVLSINYQLRQSSKLTNLSAEKTQLG